MPQASVRTGVWSLLALLGTLAVLGACAPAAQNPAAAPAAAPAAPAASAPAAPAWQAEWDRMLAAARQEGVVNVAGPPGDLNRDAYARAFEAAYPGIRAEYQGKNGRDIVAQLLAERDAGRYLLDVYIGGAESPRGLLKPRGALEPLAPALILPENTDNANWLGGFNTGFMDSDNMIYSFQGQVSWIFYVNRDVVPERELSTIEQLLEPRWKGKISWDDPRGNGPGSGDAGYVNMTLGEGFLRSLLQQDVVASTDHRQRAEWLVRGTYPIAIGMQDQYLTPFREQGLGLNLKPLEPNREAARRLNPVAGSVVLVNQAPHPNAAKVYVNWLLSKAGQTAFADITKQNSRRADVTAGPDDTRPSPNQQYKIVNAEENQNFITRAQELANEILR
jgi:iron(III) transport system substrate-binding protein